MEKIKKINKIFLSFEVIPFAMMILLAFLPVIAGIINNRLQYGRDFGDRVSFYCYISIMVAYAIPFYFRFLHVRSFRENKKSGQPAYHFWEFFIKPNRKPIELKDFFIKNR
ncbi:DUF5083 family protein [Staphylococcus aureus]|uniref:DUF5083 family protein n=1 Tax=Staphylococcus aureus TaxID=1280 RepID=UPI0010BF632B|nr:DUF5083 family protein [Staphylococcus aureus]TXD24480.1 DUF5083 domain-containing protein [Staphylococcus aureus]